METKLTLENRERDIADDEAELTYLKLRVRLDENQELPYVPEKGNNDLAEWTREWKMD